MRFSGWLQILAVCLIGVYQLTLSKVLRRWIACRFHPRAQYGIVAIQVRVSDGVKERGDD